MANLLFLVHRMPYPPDKGDKVRSFHMLKHLVARHRVFVGTFMDDPDDAVHVETLRSLCSGLHVCPLHPHTARLASLAGFVTNAALKLHCYRDEALRQWVAGTLEREAIDAVVVFSSSMAPYAEVFTGAMDWWPQFDAEAWFVGNVLPEIQRRQPLLGFARGLHNEILEAMAVERPVVASVANLGVLTALHSNEILAAKAAQAAQDYERLIFRLTQNPESAGQRRVNGGRPVRVNCPLAASASLLDRNSETCAPLAVA